MSPITEKSIGLDGEVFPDRRGKPRQKCLRGAVASFNKGSSVFECVAKNISETGARLSFGCNIGALFSGIASGSVHGWLWFAAAFAGSFVGVWARGLFGLDGFRKP